MTEPDLVAPADEPARMRARLDALGLPGLIDIHTHFMPKPVMDKVWDYFDRVGPRTGRPWPIVYRHSQDCRLQILASLGVRHYTSLAYPHKADMAAWLNQWSADFAAANPRCVHSATFYPEQGAASYVRDAIDSGARVFKAHLQVGGYDPNDPLLDRVWHELQATGTPVVIHAGNGPAPGPFTGPVGMQRLLSRYPDLTLVVAHMGLPDYTSFLDLAEHHHAVHLDTTMAFTPFTEAAHPFPRAHLQRLGDLADRIVFGSDFPNIPYPYLDAVDAVLNLGLGTAWNAAVLHGNAERLLGLRPDVPAGPAPRA